MGPAPSVPTLATTGSEGYEDLVKVVTDGVKGTPMGPWGYALGRKRLLQVVAYVFSLKGTREARQR